MTSLLMLLAGMAVAQVEEALDSLQKPLIETEWNEDSVIFFAAPTEIEYIPADETPALVADRLSCIQRTIPLTYNDKVHAFINYFTVRDREYTKMVMRRKDLYFPLFEKYLAKYNLPDELKYLSIVESGLLPKAVSRARAVGLWQFMSGTGKYFNLHHDWYMDDRMDPDKSTDAACRYLAQLYSIFGDWQLALAAYNSGPGTVRKAVKRSGHKNSFWEVYNHLPRETRAYVPQFIAITYVMNYADKHNFTDNDIEELLPFDTIQVSRFFHFETFASLTGSCLEDLQKLNPHVLRNAIPETGRTYAVKIPLEAKLKLATNRLAILDSCAKVGVKELEVLARTTPGSTQGKEMIVYKVRSGDVLGSIAQKHHVRVDDLKAWNRLRSNMIHPGKRLNIWVSPSKESARPVAAQQTAVAAMPLPDGKTYTVQPGDTLWHISKKFQGVTVEKIKTLNKLKSNKLQPGQKLIIG